MYKKLTIVAGILLFLFYSNILFAGTKGKISGNVTDSNGEPLIGANITVAGTNSGASTDVNGRYFIIDFSPRNYDIKIQYIGYGTQIKTNVKVVADRTTKVDFIYANSNKEKK